MIYLKNIIEECPMILSHNNVKTLKQQQQFNIIILILKEVNL